MGEIVISRGAGKRARKTRSDKKRDVKPTILIDLKDCIYRVSHITSIPVKDVSEELCILGITDTVILNYLSESFRRDVRIDDTLYLGDVSRQSNRRRGIKEESERLSIRFRGDMYERLSVLAYALDCSVARACGMLLDASMRDVDIVNRILKKHLKEGLDNAREVDLKRVYKYISMNNPHKEVASWGEIAKLLFGEIKSGMNKISEKASATNNHFIIESWRDK